MIKIKYLTIMLLLFIVNNNNVNAICMNSSINNYKKEAEKIEVSYEYNDDYYLDGKKVNGTYKVIVKNMPSSMYAEIIGSDIKYEYNEDNIIIIEGVESGIQKLAIYYEPCYEKLKTIKLNLPKYNKYSDREECVGVDTEKLDVCDKWYPYELNESIFRYKLKEYKTKLEKLQEEKSKLKNQEEAKSIINFLYNYYIYIILGMIVIIIVIVLIIKNKKKYSLE